MAFGISIEIKTDPAVVAGSVFALVVPKATPGYAGGIKIAFSEE